MADIVISFNTNARQDDRLAKVLAQENIDRAARGEAPFSDVTAMLRAFTIDATRARIKNWEAQHLPSIQPAFRDADESVQDQVLALLDPWL